MLNKKLQRIGNSVGVILPRDIVSAADLHAGDEVTISLHGRRVLIEPASPNAADDEAASAFQAVLRRHGEAFRQMAAYDRSGKPRRAR